MSESSRAQREKSGDQTNRQGVPRQRLSIGDVSALSVLQRAQEAPGSLRPADVLQLQRTIGNRATGRLLQAKLQLGPANDAHEMEADRMAQQVVQAVRKPLVQREEDEGGTVRSSRYAESISTLQRDPRPANRVTFGVPSPKSRKVQRDQVEDELQAAPNHGMEGGDVDADVAHSIESAKGSGQPLHDGVRSSMEGAFGADFSGVNVHTGPQSDALNRSLNARAFTTGKDIFFGKGQYNPGSSGGQELIAHELTHTVQQGAAGVQRHFVIQRKYTGALLSHKTFKEEKSAKGDQPSISGFTKKGKGHGLKGMIANLYTLLHRDNATLDQVRQQLMLIRAAFVTDRATILLSRDSSEQQRARATTVFGKWIQVVDDNLTHLNQPLGGEVTEQTLVRDLRKAYNEQGGINPGDDLPEIGDMLEERFQVIVQQEMTAAEIERNNRVAEHFETSGAAFALGQSQVMDFWTPLLALLPVNMEQPPNLVTTTQQAVRPLLQSAVEDELGYEETRTSVKADTRQVEPRPLASVLVAKFFSKVENEGKAASDLAIPQVNAPAQDAGARTAELLDQRRLFTIAAENMPREDRIAFSRTLRRCHLLRQLLEPEYVPEEEVAPAAWKDNRNLQDEGNLRPVREGTNDVSERTMNAMRAKVVQANDFYKKMVAPAFLSTIAPPIIQIHAKPAQSFLAPKGFRAYQSGNEIHLAQNEDMDIVVHEVGHFVENKLPPGAWLDIRDLIAKRHTEAGGGTVASEGDTIFTRDEGRFKGEYAATGKYTSRAYGDIGSTEMMSLTLEYLANPSKINKMIDKDPQQLAIILRALNRDEYYRTPGIVEFEKYLPNPGRLHRI